MAPDLSPCRAVFDRDPVRYLDMTEPLRRGAGTVLSAAPDGALVEEDSLAGRLTAGKMLGAFDSTGALAGFIGTHEEGTIGLLEVLPAYRRRGLATLLQSHMTNLELERGHIPCGQVFDGNAPSLALQRSLGFRCSLGQMYWPEF